MTPQQFILSTEYKTASESARVEYLTRCGLCTEDNGLTKDKPGTHEEAYKDFKRVQMIETLLTTQ